MGVQLGKDDALEVTTKGTKSSEIDDEELSKSAAIAKFRATWSDVFEVQDAEGGGLLVLSPRSARCREGLSRQLDEGVFQGSPVEVLFEILKTFDPELHKLPPPSLLPVGPDGGVSAAIEALTQPTKITVRKNESLLSVLARLTATTQGVAWLAQDRCDVGGPCHCNLGLITGTAVAQTGYDAAAGLALPKPSNRP